MHKTYSLNLTFAEENANLKSVEDWLKTVGLPIATNSDSNVISSRLLKIIEVPGDPDFLKEGGNISLQLDFTSLPDAHAWLSDYYEPLLEGYFSSFERQPLCFSTILETI